MTLWDVYECEGGHLIIVEHKDAWPDDVQLVITCNICREIAHYSFSKDSLRKIEKEVRRP